MATTTITGTINGVNNAAIANKWITFRLVQLGTDATATATVAQSVDSVQTDANGDFSIDVWNNGDSGKKSILEITVDGSKAETVIIPAGTASIELWDLIENCQADGSTSEQVPTVSELFLRKASNLSDLASATTARSNLGLGTADDVTFNTITTDRTASSQEYSIDIGTQTGFRGIGAGPEDFGYYRGNVQQWYCNASGMNINQTLTLANDLAITEGGTGASTATNAKTNLGLLSPSGGGQVGFSASSTSGGAVGYFADTTSGGAVGSGADTTSGGAVGDSATATSGGAVGFGATATLGGAVGYGANVAGGGAVGNDSIATDGFAGGEGASAYGTGRVQLGTGVNSINSTIQFLDSGSATATQFGYLSTLTSTPLETSDIGSNVQAHSAILDATTASFTTAKDTAISTNTANIASNDTDIGVLTGSVVQNQTDIATNASGIATNLADIALKAPINNPTFTGTISTSATGVDFNDGNTGGELSWNDTEKTLDLVTGSDNVTLQLGQEVVMHVRNTTGSQISDGEVVMVNGSQGNKPTITLAQADTVANARKTIGVATQPIPNNSNGFITLIGKVRDLVLDDGTYTEGDVVYLSSTVAGGITLTQPDISVELGHVLATSSGGNTNGVLSVNINNESAVHELEQVVIANAAAIAALDVRVTALGG